MKAVYFALFALFVVAVFGAVLETFENIVFNEPLPAGAREVSVEQFLMEYTHSLTITKRQYREPEPAQCPAAGSATCFTVYKEASGWYVQNCCAQKQTARLKFQQTSNVFAVEDCLLPGQRKYLWWMAANPSLTLESTYLLNC
eukprot:TRINITY_DN677_c0_g1_i1.p1 TRINITY_DN677_c0_g1~~TRINITY_DN677_c0_g1_i1.p1  ORF type:complete len:159 (-),score=52.42 TRINITY_DN677_c0_g1_i1:156-584(-)